MPVATLSIDLVARLASLEEGFNKATRLGEKAAAEMEARFKRSGASIGTNLTQLFAGVSVVALTRSLINGVDALNDFKDATGASVENASALEDVARRTGTTLESVEGILVKFNGVLKDADGKNSVSLALQRIGLDAKELRQLDPAEALRRTAVALSAFAENGDRARLMQVLFDKSVREAAPFLGELAKQGRLNATVTTQQTEAFEKFNKQLLELQKNFVDVSRQLATSLVPALNDAAPRLKEFLGGEKSKYTLAEELRLTFTELEKLKALRGQGFTISGFFGTEEQREAEISKLEKNLRRLQIAYSGAASGPGRRPANEGGGLFRPGVGTGEASDRQGKKKHEARGLSGPALDRVEAFRQSELAIQARVDEVLATAQLTEQERLRAAGLKTIEERQKTLNDLLAATPTAQLEATRQEMLLLAEALERGVISEEQFIEGATTRLQLLPEQLRTAKSLTEELGLTFSSAFEDALVSGQDLRSVLQGIAQDILRITTRKFVTEPLGNFFTTFLQSFATARAARGLAFDGSGVQRFAAGGVVDRPTRFRFAQGAGLMGEDGPEAILPLVRGKGGKLGVQASGQSGGLVIQQTNHFGSGVSREEVARAVVIGNARLLEDLRRSRSRDGAFA